MYFFLIFLFIRMTCVCLCVFFLQLLIPFVYSVYLHTLCCNCDKVVWGFFLILYVWCCVCFFCLYGCVFSRENFTIKDLFYAIDLRFFFLNYFHNSKDSSFLGLPLNLHVPFFMISNCLGPLIYILVQIFYLLMPDSLHLWDFFPLNFLVGLLRFSVLSSFQLGFILILLSCFRIWSVQ